MTLSFANPGELDPRLIATFGANVKASSSAIGFFGTGLKYAIAVTLRLGGKIEIWSGQTQYNFGIDHTVIRGKDFSFVTMDKQPLGFTLELGKTWEPWMAYRELVCNARDEGGGVQTGSIQPEDGKVTILVDCPAIDQAHEKCSDIFLQTKPLWANELCEIHEGGGHAVYYRGVRVHQTQEHCHFTYNLLEHTDLTEDRTLRYVWQLSPKCRNAIAECTSHDIIRQAVLSKEKTFEHTFDYSEHSLGHDFVQIVDRLAQNNTGGINLSARKAVKALLLKDDVPQVTELSSLEQNILQKAIAFVRQMTNGEIDQYNIEVFSALGEDILGVARDGKIMLSRRVFRQGTKMVAGTILEEYIHLHHNHADCTRSMQNHLIDWLCTLQEEKNGVPL